MSGSYTLYAEDGDGCFSAEQSIELEACGEQTIVVKLIDCID
jgi:hypothetical protein